MVVSGDGSATLAQPRGVPNGQLRARLDRVGGDEDTIRVGRTDGDGRLALPEVAADLQSSAGQATAGQPNLVQIDAPAVEPDAMRYPQDRAASG